MAIQEMADPYTKKLFPHVLRERIAFGSSLLEKRKEYPFDKQWLAYLKENNISSSHARNGIRLAKRFANREDLINKLIDKALPLGLAEDLAREILVLRDVEEFLDELEPNLSNAECKVRFLRLVQSKEGEKAKNSTMLFPEQYCPNCPCANCKGHRSAEKV